MRVPYSSMSLVWKEPCRPVMPWTMTLVPEPTRMAMPTCLSRAGAGALKYLCALRAPHASVALSKALADKSTSAKTRAESTAISSHKGIKAPPNVAERAASTP